VSASVNLALHHKVQKFSSGTGSPGWSRKKGHRTVVVWWWWWQITLVCKCLSVHAKHFSLHRMRPTLHHEAKLSTLNPPMDESTVQS